MNRTCNLDTLIRENDEQRLSVQSDADLSEALRAAIMETRRKIDNAFSSRTKIPARLKDAHI